MGVDYDYIDVDQLMGEEKSQIREEVTKWNPACSFPTIVIDDEECIAGFREDEMRRLLG
jgi:glutaredoxin